MQQQQEQLQQEQNEEENLLPYAYPFLTEQLVDLPEEIISSFSTVLMAPDTTSATRSQEEEKEKRRLRNEQVMKSLATPCQFVGRIFFERNYRSTQSSRKERYCATCILIGPRTVITSQLAKAALPQQEANGQEPDYFDNIFAIFSIYGNSYTSHRYELESCSSSNCDSEVVTSISDNDLLIYQFKATEPSAPFNVKSFPKLSSPSASGGARDREDTYVLVGFPAFMDEEFSSCIAVDEDQEELCKRAMKHISKKTLICCFTNRRGTSVKHIPLTNRVMMLEIDYPGVNNITGTSGFGVFKIKGDPRSDEDTTDDDSKMEWCGIVLVNNFVKTVHHLSCALVPQFIYKLPCEKIMPFRRYCGQMLIPRGTFEVRLRGTLHNTDVGDASSASYTSTLSFFEEDDNLLGLGLKKEFSIEDWIEVKDNKGFLLGIVQVFESSRVTICIQSGGSEWLMLHSFEFNRISDHNPSLFETVELQEDKKELNHIDLVKLEEWFSSMPTTLQDKLLLYLSEDNKLKYRTNIEDLQYLPTDIDHYRHVLSSDQYNIIINHFIISLREFSASVSRELEYEAMVKRNIGTPKDKMDYNNNMIQCWLKVARSASQVLQCMNVKRNNNKSKTGGIMKFKKGNIHVLQQIFKQLMRWMSFYERLNVHRVETLLHLLQFLDWKMGKIFFQVTTLVQGGKEINRARRYDYLCFFTCLIYFLVY